MCFACPGNPIWGRPFQAAPPPVKEETVFIDSNTAWYPDYQQGIHPPAPVYQNIGQQYPYVAAPLHNMQYYNSTPFCYGNCQQQQSYYPQTGWPYTSTYPSFTPYTSSYSSFANEPPHSLWFPPSMYSPYAYNNTYSPFSLTVQPQAPGQWPAPACPHSLTAQAAMAAEHNSRLTTMSNPPAYMVGSTPADVNAQTSIYAQQYGSAPMQMPGTMPPPPPPPPPPAAAGAQPNTLAPYKPGETVQFWCRELDGSWTLRNYSEICLGDVSPGHWEKHAVTGYFFWVRQAA